MEKLKEIYLFIVTAIVAVFAFLKKCFLASKEFIGDVIVGGKATNSRFTTTERRVALAILIFALIFLLAGISTVFGAGAYPEIEFEKGSVIQTVDGFKTITDAKYYVDATGIELIVYAVEDSTTWYSDVSTGYEIAVTGEKAE